jgi:hypothetical protein
MITRVRYRCRRSAFSLAACQFPTHKPHGTKNFVSAHRNFGLLSQLKALRQGTVTTVILRTCSRCSKNSNFVITSQTPSYTHTPPSQHILQKPRSRILPPPTLNLHPRLPAHHTPRSLYHNTRRRHLRILAIEDNRHLLKRMPPRLGVEEVNSKRHNNQHPKKDKIVLPPQPLERDRVYKSIEEDRDDGCREGYDEPPRAQAVGPDFAGVGCLEGGPEAVAVSMISLGSLLGRRGAYMAIS